MEVWKIIFLSKWVICRFHVNLPGSLHHHSRRLSRHTSSSPTRQSIVRPFRPTINCHLAEKLPRQSPTEILFLWSPCEPRKIPCWVVESPIYPKPLDFFFHCSCAVGFPLFLLGVGQYKMPPNIKSQPGVMSWIHCICETRRNIMRWTDSFFWSARFR